MAPGDPIRRSDERGIALVAALFMVLVLSVLGSSLMYVARSETLSTLNYKTMSQARYGAESGVARAVHYLMYSYNPPFSSTAYLTAYNTMATPVTYNGNPVVLSTHPGTKTNYPDAGVAAAFAAAVQGTLDVFDSVVQYVARATLVEMRRVPMAYGGMATLQTWEVTGIGSKPGVGSAEVEVSATIGRQMVPIFQYAAFATYDGCNALSFGGNAEVDSYDSSQTAPGSPPSLSQSDGNVGTNGHLNVFGNADIYGTLSTPRLGVGGCSSGNVTGMTVTGNAAVAGGMVELSQAVEFPTPPDPNPMPPTTGTVEFKTGGCPSEASAAGSCTTVSGGFRLSPSAGSSTVVLGNVQVSSNKDLHLTAGTYILNSLELTGNGRIVIDDGPVVIHIAGKNSDGTDMATPIDMHGGGDLATPSHDASQLQVIYGGGGTLKMRGGSDAAMVLYAPNASADLRGNSNYYGAMLARTLTLNGTGALHYDRALADDDTLMMPGQYTTTGFTWRAY